LDKGRDCFQAACSEEAPVLACQRCGAPTTLSVCSVCRLKDKLGPDL
jgi:predicted RNA-binding protein with PUA domain